jgi:tRNA (guanine37-N1)-methyltransferase
MLRISILTLFPELFSSVFEHSIIKRAVTSGIADIGYIQIRDFASDSYKSVDDHPYGGGHGMILRVDVCDKALKHAKNRYPDLTTRTILLDPQGKQYTQADAMRLSREQHLILLCGHYEGIDERIRSLVDEELSVGDFIVTGGELPAMLIADSVIRLLPGTLKHPLATEDESFSDSMLEYPQYTRPESYDGLTVPSVLLSGNHAKVNEWRVHQSLIRTRKRRPDLLKKKSLRGK